MAKFEVIHPVQHDGKRYHRGATIVLADKDAVALTGIGVVKPVVEADAEESGAPVVLDRMTKPQLVDFALATHKLTLNLTFTKAEMIDAINQAAAAPVADQV